MQSLEAIILKIYSKDQYAYPEKPQNLITVSGDYTFKKLDKIHSH